MDVIHSYGVESTRYLQENYAETQDWFLFVSSAADLRTTFLILFPLLFHLQPATGVRLVWVAVLGDWINLVSKWLLFGERPYWWVQETSYYGNSTVPQLRQFPMTCETGPGSPSGHAMGSAGVYYALVTAVLNSSQRHCSSPTQSRCVKAAMWTVFWVVQVCVCLSRVFIGAHFPHQVVSGVALGVVVAEGLNRASWIHHVSFRGYARLTLFLLSFALGLYVLLGSVAVDLLWSLAKAHRWCVTEAWVRLETTPFASLLRNTGVLFGLGTALHLPTLDIKKAAVVVGEGEGSTTAACFGGRIARAPFRLICAVAAILLLHVLDTFGPPVHNRSLFYLLSFCKSATVPLTTVVVVPYFAGRAVNAVTKRGNCVYRLFE
ncbi:glucose-6-phosphatase catalytic subunit 1-like [Engraulis encrasicolus]|uniref:glucose-6-phosphatase catalytic subunit 1-like n=1 Tax=Engraulis encrasicolus TaxID=184585 RepID=UPI002FCEFEB3